MSYSKIYAYDAATGLPVRAASQAALTASGYVGTQHDQGAASATDCLLIGNIESIVTNGATGETYKFFIVGSNLANRSDGEVLGQFMTGKASQLTGSQETKDGAAGDRIVLPFRTEKNRTRYRYIDVYMAVAGTAPSIAFSAYITREV